MQDMSLKSIAPSDCKVAVVSTEFGIKKEWPIYSGGLGILAGDWLKEAADMGFPVVGLGVAWHNGYFKQVIGLDGSQVEEPAYFNPLEHGFQLAPAKVKTRIGNNDVTVGAYISHIHGRRSSVPIVLVTTNLPENSSQWHRDLTAHLYDDGNGNRDYYRTAQYRVLASGVRILQHLGFDVGTYHLNDGHGSLIALELLNQGLTPEQVREKIWFTTHTLVSAAADHFTAENVALVLPDEWAKLRPYFTTIDGKTYLGTVELARDFSRGINAVSARNAELASSSPLFANHHIVPITNGIHLPSWVNQHLAGVYLAHYGDIFEHPERFGNTSSLDYRLAHEAHEMGKRDFFALVKDRTGVDLDPTMLTIGFARRFADYKRAALMFRHVDELARIVNGETQIIFAGKAHPNAASQKAELKYVWNELKRLRESYGVNAVFIPNYDMEIGKALVGAVDLWVNNPERPKEASGTSGMKVALNGGLNASVLDGWWLEGYNGRNGWAIAPDNIANDVDVDARSLLEILRRARLQFGTQEWEQMSRESIKLAAFFNTRRCLEEYAQKAWNLSLEERLAA